MTTEFLINHTWQSSCFALLAGLLAFVLRKNSPKVRYWVWLSASLKFFVPFVLLVNLGSVVPRPARSAEPVSAPVFSNAVVEIAEPFSPVSAAIVPARGPLSWVPVATGVVWGIGFLAISLARWRSWFRIRATLRASTPIELPISVPAFIAPGAEEPGVVGFLRPVLVLPTQLLEHLNLRQLDAVLTHELCHVRRRDNLFAAIHMIVEAIFWFHPLVWWIGSRLVEERELACDEEVLRVGCEPTDYVEGILKVCRFYTESPLPCVSGVTGADVKKRLRAILVGRIARELNVARKVILAMVGLATVAGPIVIGVLYAPSIRAQSRQETAPPLAFEIASLKLSKPGTLGGGIGPLAGGQTYIARGIPLRTLITTAYNVADNQVSGGPSWVSSQGFDLEAKTGRSVTREERLLMMQTLLAERFKLTLRRETRQVPVYALVVEKTGAKLQVNTNGAQSGLHRGDKGQNVGQNVPMSLFVWYLQNTWRVDRPVLDQTGLKGSYDWELDFSPEPNPLQGRGTNPNADAAPDLSDRPPLFEALRKQLGLRLEPEKGSVEFLTIEHVEMPSEN
jgi:bla regulator protein BlaR1